MKEDVMLIVNDTSKLMMRDYGLGLTGFNISPPTAKTSFIDIPYSNVSYDLTEYFGEVAYNRRPITLSFGFVKPLPCWQKVIDELANTYHGRLVRLRFVSASDWYYEGRCSVNSTDKNDYNNAQVILSFNALLMKMNKKGEKRL